VLTNSNSDKKCLPESPVVTMFADYFHTLFSSITAEPLPEAMDNCGSKQGWAT
jgi:hypothetical protein